MSVSKDDLRINESDYYKIPTLREQPTNHRLTADDVADPGRIALTYGFSHDMWKVILKFNSIVDPIDELIPGLLLEIPSQGDVQRLRKI